MEYQNQTNQITSNSDYHSYGNSDVSRFNDSNSSLETPPILIQRGYQYIDQIGEGSNGKTYKARNSKTGEIVAIKALKFSDNLKNYELFKREAKALQSININGVPKYYDYISQEDEFTECWLVQEYIQGDSLLKLLESNTHFDELEILLIMREITRIVHDLQTFYTPPIIHRDIKPSNILIQRDENKQIKVNLIDFGAVANPQKRSGGSTVAGTVGYMAPEQLVGDCTIQSDYYSIGATALHLFLGYDPSNLPSNGFELHYEDRLKFKVRDIHPKTLALLKNLLAPQAQNRPKDTLELYHQINEALMELYKSGNRTRRKQMRHNKLAGTIGRFFKFIILFLAILFCFLGVSMIITGLTGSGAFSVLFGIIALPVGILLINFALKLESSSEASTKAYEEAKAANILSSTLDAEMETERRKKSLGKSKNVVQGQVVAVFPRGIEYIFSLKDKTYTGFQPGYKRLNIGDTVQVHTRNRGCFGGIRAWLE